MASGWGGSGIPSGIGGGMGWTGGVGLPVTGWTSGMGDGSAALNQLGGMGAALPALAEALGKRTAQQQPSRPQGMQAGGMPPGAAQRAIGMARGQPMGQSMGQPRMFQAGGAPPPAAGPSMPATPFDMPPDPEMIARLHRYATTRGITPEPGIGHPAPDRALEQMSPYLLQEVLPALPEFATLPGAGHRAWKNLEERLHEFENLPVIEPERPKRKTPSRHTPTARVKARQEHARGGVTKRALMLAKRKRRVAGSRR